MRLSQHSLRHSSLRLSGSRSILCHRPDTVLSLKVRSHMVGGLAMEQSCRALEKCLSDGDPSSTVIAAQHVAKEAHALRLALEGFLRQ